MLLEIQECENGFLVLDGYDASKQGLIRRTWVARTSGELADLVKELALKQRPEKKIEATDEVKPFDSVQVFDEIPF